MTYRFLQVSPRPSGLPRRDGIEAYCWSQVSDFVKALVVLERRPSLKSYTKLFPSLQTMRMDLVKFTHHLPFAGSRYSTVMGFHSNGIVDELLVSTLKKPSQLDADIEIQVTGGTAEVAIGRITNIPTKACFRVWSKMEGYFFMALLKSLSTLPLVFDPREEIDYIRGSAMPADGEKIRSRRKSYLLTQRVATRRHPDSSIDKRSGNGQQSFQRHQRNG